MKKTHFSTLHVALSLLLITLIIGCGGGGGTTLSTPVIPATSTVVNITPTVNGTPTLNTSASLLPTRHFSQMANFTENDEAGTAEIRIAVPDGDTLETVVGDILVLEDGHEITESHYPFQKVVRRETDGDYIILHTEHVPLAEAFKTLDVEFTHEVQSTDVSQVNLAPGVSLVQRQILEGTTVSVDLNRVIVQEGLVTVSTVGRIDMTLKVFFKLNIEEGKIYGFGTSLIAVENSSCGFKATGAWSGSKDVNLGTIFKKTLRFKVPVGGIPVPVSVDVEIPLLLGISANLKAETETRYERQDSGTLGVLYNQVTGNWTGINVYQSSEKFTPPTLTGEANLSVFLGPKLDAKIYGLAGPWVTLQASLGATAAADADVKVMPTNVEWEIRSGLKSEAGADLEKIRKYLGADIPKLEMTLLDPTKPGLTNRQLSNGPDLKGLSLDVKEVSMLVDGTLNLDGQIQPLGKFDDKDHPISYEDTRLTLTASAGTLAGTVFTAPNTAGEYKVTYNYHYKNKFDTSSEATGSVELTINVGEAKKLDSINVQPPTATIAAGATLDLTTFTVTASYNDNTTANVTTPVWSIVSGGGTLSDTSWTAPESAGEAFLRVRYTEGEISRTSNITVTISTAVIDNPPVNGGEVTTLTNSVASSNVSGTAGESFDFKIIVPAGQSYLVIGSANGSSSTGSIYTYIKAGSIANATNNDFADTTGSSVGNGKSFVNPQAGEWYIRVTGVSDFTNFFTKAEYYPIPSYTLANNMDSEGELTKTTISSTNSALLTYTLSAQETAAVDGTGWFYINITPMNTAGVFWSFDPQGLPGMDPSWKQEENLYQNGTSAIINFNDTVKFSGKQTIYIFLDDEAMNGDATAFGETITGN